MLHEPTTALTDLLLGIEALALALLLILNRRSEIASYPSWILAFCGVGTTALAGFLAHGLGWYWLFPSIYAGLALSGILFLFAAAMDLFSTETSRQIWLGLVAAAVGFLLATTWLSVKLGAFTWLAFVIMLVLTGLYLRIALKRRRGWAGHLAAGVGLTALAALLYAIDAKALFIWEFDRNGLYHSAQIVGLFFIYRGIRGRATPLLPDGRASQESVVGP